MQRLSSVFLLAFVIVLSFPLAACASGGAYLGVATRAPSSTEVVDLDLSRRHRVRGQIIEVVADASPAAQAGLRRGDVVVSLDDNDIYSRDDIRDFLNTSSPGRKVRIHVKRPGTSQNQSVLAELGKPQASPKPESGKRLEWDFAGLAQLPLALETAKDKKKNVLVGLSGAET